MNCSSLHQWELARNGSVEFDADIVGPGVITSFISAALTAVITLFFAFTTHSVPEELTNDVDEIVAGALRAFFTFIRTTLHIPSISKTDGEKARDDRLKAFQTFMLSVSDQVLASEMAILIATFARYSDITLYSVNVVVALGCLASTVHLAMMPLLVRQMREHHVIKASRSISMVIAAILLVVLLVLQISNTWSDGTHIYFRCAIHDFQLHPQYIDWLSFTVQLLVPIFIIYGNYEVIRLLYSTNHDNNPDTPVRANKAIELTTRRENISRAHQELREMRRHSRQSRIRRLWARHRAHGVIEAKVSPRGQKNNAMLIAETWAFYESQESFLWRILWLISGNIYGITDVFQTRSDTSGISGDRDTMGYGQIVPLVLLVLPVFSAIQSIYDYRDRIKAIQHSKEDSEHCSTIAETSNSPLNLEGDCELATDPVSADNWPAPGQLSRSATTATEFHSPTDATRRRSHLTSNQSLINEYIIRVYTSPTLDPQDNANPDSQTQAAGSINSSLQKLAQSDKYQDILFVRIASYMHTILMLAFVVLFGWTMAAGPAVLTPVLLSLLMVLNVRRLFGLLFFRSFARKHVRETTKQDQQGSGKITQSPPDHS